MYVFFLVQYEACIEDFKESHKLSEQAKSSGFSTVEIKKDIASMEAEKEQVTRLLTSFVLSSPYHDQCLVYIHMQ